VLPNPVVFTLADHGVVVVHNVKLTTAGPKTLTVKEEPDLGVPANVVTLNPQDPFTLVGFTVTPLTPTPTPGVPFLVRIIARSGPTQTAVAYTGTALLTSNDPLLPDLGTVTFEENDHGVRVVPVVLRTQGPVTITARDRQVPSATGAATVLVQG